MSQGTAGKITPKHALNRQNSRQTAKRSNDRPLISIDANLGELYGAPTARVGARCTKSSTAPNGSKRSLSCVKSEEEKLAKNRGLYCIDFTL